ncbi:divergent polysaccharide deacetylase family protein [Gemmobacter sp.]|uniref:divergent polysaccharide deacetylase family protein n=1 Tax=Gemmobacter sp. TaxID=1898957 RepID=UPI002AFE66D5|nr:divergent polysaccharide deacetylase family protein [Gemmobacter sp.]
MEVAMEALAAAFPDALALTDLRQDGAQGDRAWAGAVVPALAARGYGLVTWDQGLNAADQVARRAGLPAVTIFRDLDARDEGAPVIRRYLDRAAFKAQQDGRAVVIGRLRPETVAALLEWALDGRAASLGLAPLSAVFPQ